ncbi:hypothetical protein QBC39DRAFT_161636 [Podospora conica]|nr:hypothetical protein QBC39DRAFT_161636 [Schizothecium conicum]
MRHAEREPSIPRFASLALRTKHQPNIVPRLTRFHHRYCAAEYRLTDTALGRLSVGEPTTFCSVRMKLFFPAMFSRRFSSRARTPSIPSWQKLSNEQTGYATPRNRSSPGLRVPSQPCVLDKMVLKTLLQKPSGGPQWFIATLILFLPSYPISFDSWMREIHSCALGRQVFQLQGCFSKGGHLHAFFETRLEAIQQGEGWIEEMKSR